MMLRKKKVKLFLKITLHSWLYLLIIVRFILDRFEQTKHKFKRKINFQLFISLNKEEIRNQINDF